MATAEPQEVPPVTGFQLVLLLLIGYAVVDVVQRSRTGEWLEAAVSATVGLFLMYISHSFVDGFLRLYAVDAMEYVLAAMVVVAAVFDTLIAGSIRPYSLLIVGATVAWSIKRATSWGARPILFFRPANRREALLKSSIRRQRFGSEPASPSPHQSR